jgi:uncharacterized membrane protein YraQ (UPF0718 family)
MKSGADTPRNARRQPARRSGPLLLALVLLLYLGTALSHPEILRPALRYSLNLFGTLLPILAAVLFLMGLFDSFVDARKIARLIGRESGLRGWGIALLGGVLSHGPGYVWYPMIQEMRRHGARDGLVVAFFYARSIKLPWLPLMVIYMGTGFTLFFTLYVLMASWLQGLIAQRLLLRDPTRTPEEEAL